jgi:hypothetical protein
MEASEAFLRIEGKELFEEPGRFGAGPGESGVDRTEDRGKGVGLVKLEQPPADFTTTGADGEQVEELCVLFRRPVHGEQALQGGGIEVIVLHAILL